MNEYLPDSVSLPGETLQETLAAYGMSWEALAQVMECEETAVRALLHGQALFTPAIAEKLTNAFPIPATFWLRLQDAYSTAEYQQKAARTLVVTDRDDAIKLCLIGLLGEAGEVAEPLKKHLYAGHPLDLAHVEKEVGDLLWYLANLCTRLGIDMNNAMRENIQKLEQRYPDGFSCENSLHRTV